MTRYGDVSRRVWLLLLALAWLLFVKLIAPVPTASADVGHQVAVPMALRAPQASGSLATLCPEAQAMAALISGHAGQRRPAMTLDPTLQQVAQAKAEDMARRDYFDHTNPDGYGPNWLVRQAGYPLPSYYQTERTANNLESLAAGSPHAQEIFEAWLNSPYHRSHVLGEDPFFATQVEYGIGYATNPDSQYDEYWVFISASRAG